MYLADLCFSTRRRPSLSPRLGRHARRQPDLPGAAPPAARYWQVAADGGVFTFGGAQFYGSTGSIRLNQPVVGIAPTPDAGYWLVASDGGVFAYGDAGFYGSTGAIVLNKPIIGMIPTSRPGLLAGGQRRRRVRLRRRTLPRVRRRRQPGLPGHRRAPSYLGGGYWLVDPTARSSATATPPYEGQPRSHRAGTPSPAWPRHTRSNGYWMASANGNVADFGDAAPYGSMYGRDPEFAIVGMAATRDGAGYWLRVPTAASSPSATRPSWGPWADSG